MPGLAHIKSRLRRVGWVYRIRRRLLAKYNHIKYGLRHVHPTFYINGRAMIASDLVAGAYSFVNAGCRIGPKVELGNYVMFGPDVAVLGGDHLFDVPGNAVIFSGRPELKKTIIEDDVWLAYRVIVIAGVRIGRGAIVAAGAVVTKDIPPYEIWGGVPARKIGNRFIDETDIKKHDNFLANPPEEGNYCDPLLKS